ncbi:hypothetical protein NIES2098_73140 (plasmid) [Calothrix sp. NIES-2098]|nr:hypothetical protein NIES2098_73140 [Calothrix sp. NIES-2098]
MLRMAIAIYALEACSEKAYAGSTEVGSGIVWLRLEYTEAIATSMGFTLGDTKYGGSI